MRASFRHCGARSFVLAVSVLIIAFGSFGCTSLLGDFDVGADDPEAGAPEAGGADATFDAKPLPPKGNPEGGRDGGPDAPGADGMADAATDAESDGGSDAGTDARAEAGPLCAANQLECNGACVAKDDPKHCGACAHDCTNLAHVTGVVTCSAGACVVPASACAAGWAHCSTAADDGCEVKLDDPKHCGSCTTACAAPLPLCGASGAGYACKSSCVAPAPDLCGQSCVSKSTDPQNCGQCGTKCPAPASHGAAACTGGTCALTCNAGYTLCGGACVDLTADAANCGACGVACKAATNGTSVCTASKCVSACNAGYHDCGGTCSLNTSVATCGTSCTKCPDAPAGGSATCNGTACGFTCNAPTTACNGACLNLSTNVANCGTCGHACAAPGGGTTSCAGGACVPSCGAGLTLCNGQCVNLATDGANCGTCGRSCGGGTCAAGTCRPVAFLSGRSAPAHLTSEAAALYWMEGNVVEKSATASGVAATLPLRCDPPLVVTGGRAYCTNGLVISTAAVGGGPVSDFVTTADTGDTWALASSGGNVVFQHTDHTQVNPFGDVDWCPGGAACASASLMFKSLSVTVATSAAGLAFVSPNPNGIIAPPPPSAGYCASVTTCSTRSPVASDVTLFRLALSPNGVVYFTRAMGTTLTGCPSSGCTNETPFFTTTAGDIAFIVTDTLGVYWAVQNALYGCPGFQCGNASTPLAVSTTGNINSAAFDGTSLFYATDSVIYRLVR